MGMSKKEYETNQTNQVRRLATSLTPAFTEATDKNVAWESLLDDTKELYAEHCDHITRNKHALLRRL
jgi:hypothetical protein